ncbi:MAG TPA: two-component regulator propeller domain-containing protein [Bryobacteraceae bacterium]|jgi:signal transduction histidine kinase/streptogramin lyase|nr:two-component regulator propeller domain-containing protein [Bryobacteraceae bacterium]
MIGAVFCFRVCALLLSGGLLLYGLSSQATAEDTANYQVINLPIADGTDLRFAHVALGISQSHGRVSQIVEDNHGLLWFGTQDGLERYDGYSARDYRHDPADSNSLQAGFVLALFKDRSGKLWIASAQYFDRYDPVTNVFTHYPLPTGKETTWVAHISQDRNGMIWLATNHGLARLDPNTSQITQYQHRPDDPSSLSGDQITFTYETKDGNFWVASKSGLDVFDRRTGKVTLRVPMRGPFPAGEPGPISLLEDHAGVLWVAYTSGNGLAAVDREHRRLIHYSFGNVAAQNSLFSGVRSIYEDSDGTLWLGTNSSGLLRFDRNRTHFVRYRNNPTDPESLSADRVDALFEDHEGDLWIGTTGGGLNRTARRPLPFQRYGREPGNPSGLTTVSSVFEDSQGILWVGSRGTLYRIDRRAGKFTYYRKTGGTTNLSSNYVLSIAEDKEGYLWFGTWGGGLDRFDRRTGQFKVYRHDPSNPASLPSDQVWSIFVDHGGTMWVGGEQISRFDPKTQGFHTYEIEGNVGNYRSMAQAPDGAILAGSWGGGLRRIDSVTGKSTIYRHSAVAGSLSSDQVNAICVDHSGVIWVATESGLNRMDPVTKKFTWYFERAGLPNSNVNGILEDDRGHLWLSTNSGLSKFDPRNGTFSNYYASDGLWVSEFFGAQVAWKSPRGEMFFCSYTGLTSFFPDQVVDNPYIPPVVVTDFQLFGKPVPIGGESPLKESITVTNTLTLSYKQNFFSFAFSALSYASAERNRYRYKLGGLENEWNETDGNHRTATYTALPPGDYVFRVIGSNNRGLWNSRGTSIRIRILPPWWETWWFRGLAIGVALSVLWAIYYIRVRGIKQRNRELEEAEKQILALNEKLINAQEDERARIARELHDDFSQQIAVLGILISNLRQNLPDHDRAARDHVERLREKLLRLAECVRHLSHRLHPAILELAGIASALRAHCTEFTSVSAVAVSFVSKGEFDDLPPAMAICIYRVAQEALQNVAKHADARQAEVALKRFGHYISLTITDSGAGCAINKNRVSGGLGLVSMKERVRLVNGKFSFNSAPGRGTAVEVKIPLKHSLVRK